MEQNFDVAAAKLGLNELIPELQHSSESEPYLPPLSQRFSNSFEFGMSHSRGDIYDRIARMLRDAVAQEAAEIAGRIVNDQGRLRGV
ncbi:MAG: hypothetical protein R2688_06090 [Fimbriimonadaceae bacterium]